MDLMFDLETLGVSSRAAIVQIGGCFFDQDSGHIEHQFIMDVTLQSSLDAGLEVDGKTIEFWMKQPHHNWLDHPEMAWPLPHALRIFTEKCKEYAPKHFWSHATFDVPILVSAYKACDMEMPFHYRKALDLRTLFYMAGYTPLWDARVGDKHNALNDSVFQVNCLTEAFQKMEKEAA